jgi:outer membrane protein OmpA-like peptidoglycan-associated protein
VPLGVRVGYVVWQALAAEGELAVVPTKMRESNLRSTVIAWRAHAAYSFFPEGRPLRPFAVLGGGFMSTGKSAPDLVADTDFSLYGGGGVKYRLTERWSLRGDARLLLPPSSASTSATVDVEVLFGAYTTFGKATRITVDRDTDGDGITGAADSCPNEPETVNGFQDADGCPDDAPDTDGDGIADNLDKCAEEPETVNAFQDEDGCPDEVPDTDGDEIADNVDECVDQPEDKDGFEDENGCPDLDNDGDSVADAVDGCPDQAGPVDNKGCPDTDRDGDTVVDRLDNCPDEPGSPDFQGCVKKQRVVLGTGNLKILETIFFDYNRARIKRRSHALLDNVAAVLAAHPQIRVRVEGHTDSTGDLEWNRTLSQKRAEAVAAYLISKGVAADRLEPVGLGSDEPIGDNETKTGQAENRRVEFDIIGDTP